MSLQQNTTLPVTFTGVYRQRIQDDSLDHHPFNKIPLVGIDFTDQVRHDSLRSYVLADSLTTAGTELLINYFQALADLSATGSAFTPVQLKSATFENFLQTSAVKLTPDQATSFIRISSLLGSAATGAYRRRKLATLLTQSYADVGKMLFVMAFAYERLAAVVDISRDQQYGYYKTILIEDRALTYLQKRDLARRWLQTSQSIEQSRQAVMTYVKTLKTIKEGYDELYQKRNELTKKEVLTDVTAYISTLKQLRTDLNQLNFGNGRSNP